MMQNYQNFDFISKFQKKIAHIWGIIVEKLKGGLRFWSLAIYIIYNKKFQNSSFLSAAHHGENGFQVC